MLPGNVWLHPVQILLIYLFLFLLANHCPYLVVSTWADGGFKINTRTCQISVGGAGAWSTASTMSIRRYTDRRIINPLCQ